MVAEIEAVNVKTVVELVVLVVSLHLRLCLVSDFECSAEKLAVLDVVLSQQEGGW
jgi:hypothetical protein